MPVFDPNVSVTGSFDPTHPVSVTFMNSPHGSANTSDPDKPNFIEEDLFYMHRDSILCRDLRKGYTQMIRKAATYLPKYPNEHDEDWRMRVNLASFRNYYGQAVERIVAKVFSRPPMLNSDVPDEIRADLEDADMMGNDWTVVAEDFLNPALDEGISWMMVDYHTTPEAETGTLTIADEQRLGVRPYWIVIPHHRVLGCDYELVGGVYVISMFRYYTCVKVKKGQFGSVHEDQIRVVQPDFITVYVKNDQGEWDIKDGYPVPNTLGMVPVHPLNLAKQENNMFLTRPPLEGLAYMNLEHFQIRTDQRRALSVASFPILMTRGVELKGGTVTIGPMHSFAFEDEKADMKWVESQGVHLKAGDTEIKNLENDIRTFGLAFENPGMYATATGRSIDASDAVAPIIRWAYRMRDALNMVLYYHAKWRKLENGGTVNVDVSFIQNMLTIESLKLLVEAYKEGALSPEAFLERLKDYGILRNDFDVAGDVKKTAEIAAQKAEEMIRLKEAGPAKPEPSVTDVVA